MPPFAPPRVLARHGDLLALHKPAGWRVHPAGPSTTPDLLAWIAAQPELDPRIRPIHRLDADASGLVLCAAGPTVRAEVSGWLARGEAERLYLAMVHGRTHRKGIIRRPLPDGRRGQPLPAVTRYRRLDWIGAFTLLEVRIETGRKHQIRRHLQGVGHPIVGDARYPGPRFRAVPAFPGRLWLHALAMQLPDETILEDPLPAELARHLERMREGEGPVDASDDYGPVHPGEYG